MYLSALGGDGFGNGSTFGYGMNLLDLNYCGRGVAYFRQRAQGARARNSEMKRPGTRERAIRPGGAPEANAELAASLAHVRISEDLHVVVGLAIFGSFCGGFCFEDRTREMEFDMSEWSVAET